MAQITKYICQPYLVRKKNILNHGAAIVCINEQSARVRAERLIENQRAAGVDVIKLTADPDAGDYGEPEYLARLGRVPALD